ncbi:hypothetical protein LZC95_31570 [Pendulispora brunnea]|uniref:Uncharacterized protein n=1 Tax=Pendulispora brunnea TaxID=2905690 RepID=A0ABZ2K1C5_9BACT
MAAVSRDRARAWTLGGLAISFGVGIVAACGSNSDNGADVVPTNDAGTDRGSIIPQPVVHVPVAIAAGGNQVCATMDDGRVFCWGANDYGQLGNPQGTPLLDGGFEFDGRSVATPALASVSHVTQLSTMGARIDGGYEVRATCAILPDAQAQCWGSSQFDELGRGMVDRLPHPEAMPVTKLGPVEQIVTSGGTSCAVSAQGAQCWGYSNRWNDAGVTEGGVAKERTISGLLGSVITQIALGDHHGCVLTNYGGIYCWGLHDEQQGPERVWFAKNARVNSISAGRQTTCALLTAGMFNALGPMASIAFSGGAHRTAAQSTSLGPRLSYCQRTPPPHSRWS